MTKTVRNVLLAIVILLFGGIAFHDYTKTGSHSMLQDLFLGTMICYLIMRVSRIPRRTNTPTA